MQIKFFDILIIIFFLCLSLHLYKLDRTNNVKVEIRCKNKKNFFELDKNRKFKVECGSGYLIVEIKNKKVRVVKSTCPNKICVKTGWISKKGETIACVPNNIIIKIVGNTEKKENKVDFITK